MDQQLIVAGFHRSGTSFVTQTLHEAGLFVGDDLLDADVSNPYGHFEDTVPFQIHRSVLADNGVDWRLATARPLRVSEQRWQEFRAFVDDRRAHHRLWGFKDPRVCFFLGIWKHLLPEARILVVFRGYRDAVWSLRRRHSRNLLEGAGDSDVHEVLLRDPDLALNMWVAHNEALLSAVTAYREDVMVVPLQAVQQGYPLVGQLNRRFGLGLDDVDAERLFDPGAMVAENPPLSVRSTDIIHRAERTLSALWNVAEL